MFNFSKYRDKLKNDIGEKRFNHVIRVKDMALKLNNGIDEEKVVTAALLHDCAKYNEKHFLEKYKNQCDFSTEILTNKSVLHSFLGPIVAKNEYGINDIEILNAIKYHTTGRENMNDLEKIIFLADACEEKRDYEGVEDLRKLAFKNLDDAVLFSLDGTIKSLIDRKIIIFPLTIKARNYLLRKKNG